MHASELSRAVAAALATASTLGLKADDAVVLHNSNRIAVRLLPCDTVARVAPMPDQHGAAIEVEVARLLGETDSPVASLDPRVEPRVYVRDGFAVTLWTYYEPLPPPDIAPREYAGALDRLHTGLRQIDLAAPHFTDRVAEAQGLVESPADSPELSAGDRELLSNTLRSLKQAIVRRGAPEQLLHGEPHPGNLLRTKSGLFFIDWQTCCRGPVEFDIAHCARISPDASWYIGAEMPGAVAEYYPGADPELVRTCWVLVLAMVAAWRWDRRDQFPDGRRMGVEFTNEIRKAVERYGLEIER